MADEPNVRRKLAAILSADVVGFSRLMADDEAATVETLKAYRAAVARVVERHAGRVVNTPGDSILADFPSAVEAVQCAVEIQQSIKGRNVELPPERRMEFRLGVNLGDVIEEADGTIYGDGVNIAARMEALAGDSGICISGKVHDEIEGKLSAAFVDAGEHEVKNIVRPIRVWHWQAEGAARATPASPDDPLSLPDKPSIAVLPFDNMSGDPEQEYFADGIAEDVITDLSKISRLFVIARNSSFTYKGKPVKVQEIAKDLGVRYVLEGSVRRARDRVRVTAQLVDATNGQHLWAERYDRQLDDIFAVQDDVSRSIVAALKLKLTSAEQTNLVRRGTSNLDAYDAFMHGREWTLKWTHPAHDMARQWLEKAIALDPDFADPVAHLATIHVVAYINQWGENWRDELRVTRELASKAFALDDRSPHAHYALGASNLWDGQLEDAIAEQKRAIALDANMSSAHMLLGMAVHYSGDSAAAEEPLETALRLDPIGGDNVMHYLALCHFMLGNLDAAAEILRRRIAQTPSSDSSRALLVATYGHMGRIEEAQAAWAELMEVNPDYSFAERRKVLPYRNQQDPERIAEGLRKAGIQA